MASVFSKIVSGEIPCYKIVEDDRYLAFLDINPLAKGHVLVIPKLEVDYVFDLDDNVLSGLHLFTKKVAIALKKSIPCTRIGLTIIGIEVPHAHIHLIPINSVNDMNFSSQKHSFSHEEMIEIANQISVNI